MPIETDEKAAAVQPESLAPSDSPARVSGPLEDLQALQRELRELVHDQLRLAALELKLAVRGLATVIVAAVCIGFLLMLVVAGVLASAGFGLLDWGMRPAAVMLVLSSALAVLILLLGIFMRRQLGHLGFSATLRSLKPGSVESSLPDKNS